MHDEQANTIQTEVLIVGAGPTGLSLACQLAATASTSPFSISRRA